MKLTKEEQYLDYVTQQYFYQRDRGKKHDDSIINLNMTFKELLSDNTIDYKHEMYEYMVLMLNGHRFQKMVQLLWNEHFEMIKETYLDGPMNLK